jgi:uncharacterized protein (TIGR02117 family)
MRIPLLFVVLLLGCANAPEPPQAPPDCAPRRAVQVVDHGLHAGLLLPAADLLQRLPGLAEDFPGTGFIELGWGDEGFYRNPDAGFAQGVQALFWSGDSVLHLVQLPARPTGGQMTLALDEAGYQRLLDYLLAGFALDAEGRPQALGPGLYGHSRFYRANGRYSLLNTCNSWVAEALAAAGLPLGEGSPLTASGLMRQLRRPALAGFICQAP